VAGLRRGAGAVTLSRVPEKEQGLLASLSIRNFVLIEDASVGFGPSLTVLTGETGAGKTLLTQALGLLMGERAPEGLVGNLRDDALLEAVFELSEREALLVPEEIREFANVEAGDLIASRRLSRSGRNRCFLNGVTVPLAHLGAALGGLIAFSGQYEHRRLLEPEYQRDVLDAFAGAGAEVHEYRAVFRATVEAGRRLAEADAAREEHTRERELLEFQVAELRQAALSQTEEEELLAEQRLLARAEEMKAGLSAAAHLLNTEGIGPAEGADCLSSASRARALAAPFEGLDATLDEQIAALNDVYFRMAEVARDLRRFAESTVVDPARLGEVEARLRLYTDLGRKYGGSTAAAVEFLCAGEERLVFLEEQQEDIGRLTEERRKGVERCLELALSLSSRRNGAATRLEEVVERELADLDMAASRVIVKVNDRDDWEGLSDFGGDTVEFLLASNPSLPPRPLARIASGGELSRTLLAVKCALLGVEGPETLVFDEVDAGVGGLTALSVGKKLKELAQANQVIVITHLPQVAAFADEHYRIEKSVVGSGTVTRLTRLDAEAALRELSRMMGGRPDDEGALAHARALRDRAASGLLD